MKKLWLFSITLSGLFLLCGCNLTLENSNSEDTSTNNSSNTILSKNVECQKLLDDFENNYPKERNDDYKYSNYGIFYSSVRDSCLWTYDADFWSKNNSDNCSYIVDLFDSAYEESFCESSNNFWDFYSEAVWNVKWKNQYPFYINGYYELEWLKEDRIQYLKWNIDESDIKYKNYAHPKSYEHELCK